MPNRVVFAPVADADLMGVHEYILRESGSRRTADAFIERIHATARDFASQPKAGANAEKFL